MRPRLWTPDDGHRFVDQLRSSLVKTVEETPMVLSGWSTGRT